jgi:DNA-binding HxlR family transcriptional regulator
LHFDITDAMLQAVFRGGSDVDARDLPALGCLHGMGETTHSIGLAVACEMSRTKAVSERSGCPINLTLEVVGDKWSLLVIRDMMFGNRRHFRELLTKSEEGISSNILADRLKTLLGHGIITRQDDPSHKQKGIYSLTEQGIELLPILAQMAGWGVKYLPVSEELGIRARLLSEGGPKMWAEFMDELRETHLGARRRRKAGSSVGDRLQAAFERVAARKAKK